MEVEEEMDKRSFIRGFGMGVLFAAVILGISCLMRTSDSAVIKRAKQLGMTYASPDQIVEYDDPATDYVKQYDNIPESGVLAQSDKNKK